MDAIRDELGGDRVICFLCDVSKEDDVKNAVRGTAEKWGAIHVALASAGVAWAGMTLTSKGSLDMKMFRKMVEINLYGSMYTAKYAVEVMAKNKPQGLGERGVLLFVSSVAAEEAQRGQVAYGATKGALNGVVLPMARDLGKYGIRAVTIAPGTFETPIMKNNPNMDKIKKTLSAMNPMGRMGVPSEFAHFCSSIVENSYINGVHLRIDGATKLAHL